MKNLILLPGWSAGTDIWRPVKKNLERYCNVFYCDWYKVDSVKGYKQRVHDLINCYVEGKFSIMGWSLGCLLAIEAALFYKQRIEDLIMVGGSSNFTTDKKSGYGCGWAKRVVQRMKAALRADKEKVMNDFYWSMFTEFEKNDGYIDILNESMVKTSEHDLAELEAGLDFLIEEDYREKLKEITTKVFLIHGEYDNICPIEASKYMMKNLKGQVEFEKIKNAGHIPFLTHQEYFERILSGILVLKK